MAIEFGTGAMRSLIPKLGELLLKEYNLKDTVKKGIRDLKAELETMHAALEKVSNMPLDQLDSQVMIWANESLESTKPRTFKGFIKKTRDKVSKFKIRHKLAGDIKDVKIQVREVKERHERYKINDVVANPTATTVDPRLLAMYTKMPDLVGIDKAIDELTNKLSEGDDPSGKTLRTVSIAGFGGLGKTTLAKAVHDKMRKSFDCGAFVSVGRNPDIKKILKDILLALDRQMYMDASTMDEMQLINQLREFLTDKRYMIIIDDIWDIPTWELINCAMVDSCSGSRVIITTRICGVAEKVGEYLVVITDQSVLLDNQSDEVSKKILWRCGGVPLSITTIASLLAGKQREAWSETCLLHLRIFPEDTTFGKKTLIWMWIAEGFIIDKPGTQLFELGESYLNELVNRNMIQLQQAVTFSRVRRLAIHRGSMEQINPGMEMGHVKSFNAVEWRNIRTMPSLVSFRALRVLVFFKCGFSTGSCCDLKHVRKLVHLRYLGLVDTPAAELPKDIGHDLKFLQTLDVRGSGIKELPPTVGELTKLMCLRASKGTSVSTNLVERFEGGTFSLTSLI
nr:Pm55 protein [Dasypyrum villosum]